MQVGFYKSFIDSKGSLLYSIGEDQKSDVRLFWDKRRNHVFPNSVDLKDLINFRRDNNLLEMAERLCCREYIDIVKKIDNIKRTFRIGGVNIDSNTIKDLVPLYLLRRYCELETDLLSKIYYQDFRERNGSEAVLRYFIDNDFNVINNFNRVIKTVNGESTIAVNYAANFRFKSEPGNLSIVNLPKDKRSIIIPQTDGFIYYIDFSQFEFRTYLMIHPELECDFSNKNLYRYFAEEIGVDYSDCKEKIIAYLYGQRNDELDKVLDKNAILSQIDDNFYSFRGMPVMIREDEEEHVKLHTVVQTLSQYYFMSKTREVFKILEGKRSVFLYPVQDAMLFSIDNSESGLVEEIKQILENDVYKTKQYVGKNFGDLKEI